MKKASLWKRLLAFCIDGLIFGCFFEAWSDRSVLLLFVVYETLLLSLWGGHTVGKKIMGIRVIAKNNKSVDWLKAFIRSISRVLSALPLGLGYFWALWDPQSQTWHDKIADTYVVEG